MFMDKIEKWLGISDNIKTSSSERGMGGEAFNFTGYVNNKSNDTAESDTEESQRRLDEEQEREKMNDWWLTANDDDDY